MRGHVNKCRNTRGNEQLQQRVKELERANKHAPVVVYNIFGNDARFILYVPRGKRRRR